MLQVHVVGMGMDHRDLPPSIKSRVEGADVLVGGERMLAAFGDHPARKIPVKSPLEQVIEGIREEMARGSEVVVLADGDPGFFGIGKRLCEALGAERVRLLPNVTVLQTAAARIGMSWEDLRTVSLHGRSDLWPLWRALVRGDRIGVLTDGTFHPARIAEELLDRRARPFRMHVFEDLGQEGEKVRVFDLSELEGRSFSALNFVLLERTTAPPEPLRLGLEDACFLHERGLITKREIRAVGLSMLAIEPAHTLWDIGAGCGSVAIEASCLAREGMVFALEKDPARCEMIRENIERTGAYGVEAVEGEGPGALGALPDPDRVFLGGGLGRGTAVLEEAMNRLRPGGKMVLHLVLMGSMERARDRLRDRGWPHAMSQVQVSRSRGLSGDQRLEALNPVYILAAVKPE
jgi:precorrin-6Y C5,15-methyltransferase (decarboxylating)